MCRFGWRWLGGTEEGHTFNYETKVDPVMAAEYFDPLSWETDSRTGTVEFDLSTLPDGCLHLTNKAPS